MTDADVFVVGSGDESGADANGGGTSDDAAALGTPEGRSGVPGSYVLLLELTATERIEVGALGSFEFPAGTYAYAGSAFGAGGLSRVDRHREVAAGERNVRHWHVDYLTNCPASTLRAVILLPHADVECALARALRRREPCESNDDGERREGNDDGEHGESHGGRERGETRAPGDGPVTGFGSSDCSCRSHLARVPDVRTARSAVDSVSGKG